MLVNRILPICLIVLGGIGRAEYPAPDQETFVPAAEESFFSLQGQLNFFCDCQGIVHDDYQYNCGSAHTETILETYYKVVPTSWSSLTFDFQTLLNPGTADRDTAYLGGVRLKVSF